MFLALLFLPAINALYIHHRVFHPGGPSLEYVKRAEISLDSTIVYTASGETDVLSSHVQQLKDLNINLDFDKAFYQVALQSDGDVSESYWDVSSVKLCHLYHATSDTIVLYAKDSRVHALDYFVSRVPHNGECPRRKGKKKGPDSVPLHKFNTTVILESYSAPPLHVNLVYRSYSLNNLESSRPKLRAPPALTTEGEPVKPVPEKSFIQKYWIYIVPMLIALFMSGGAEEEPQQRRAQS